MKSWILDIGRRLKADIKKAHKSLTIWFNSAMGTVVVVLPMAQDNFAQLQDYLPANLYHYLMCALIVGNIVLRFKTTSSLAGKP